MKTETIDNHISVPISSDLKRRVKSASHRAEMSQAAFVRKVLEEAVESDKPKDSKTKRR